MAFLPRGISIGLFEGLAKIIFRMKAAGFADLQKRQRGVAEHPAGSLEPVRDQSLHRGAVHICAKTAVGLAAADIRSSGDVVQRDGFVVMLMDIEEHLLKTYLGSELHAV